MHAPYPRRAVSLICRHIGSSLHGKTLQRHKCQRTFCFSNGFKTQPFVKALPHMWLKPSVLICSVGNWTSAFSAPERLPFGVQANNTGSASPFRRHSSLRNRSSMLRGKTYTATTLQTCAMSALQAINLRTLHGGQTLLRNKCNHSDKHLSAIQSMSSRPRFCRSR